MSRKLLIALTPVIIGLAGCSTSVESTYTASGAAGYRLVCGGVFGDGDMGSCYQKAGEVCARLGYRVVQTSVSSLIIECKPESAEPESVVLEK